MVGPGIGLETVLAGELLEDLQCLPERATRPMEPDEHCQGGARGPRTHGDHLRNHLLRNHQHVPASAGRHQSIEEGRVRREAVAPHGPEVLEGLLDISGGAEATDHDREAGEVLVAQLGEELASLARCRRGCCPCGTPNEPSRSCEVARGGAGLERRSIQLRLWKLSVNASIAMAKALRSGALKPQVRSQICAAIVAVGLDQREVLRGLLGYASCIQLGTSLGQPGRVLQAHTRRECRLSETLVARGSSGLEGIFGICSRGCKQLNRSRQGVASRTGQRHMVRQAAPQMPAAAEVVTLGKVAETVISGIDLGHGQTCHKGEVILGGHLQLCIGRVDGVEDIGDGVGVGFRLHNSCVKRQKLLEPIEGLVLGNLHLLLAELGIVHGSGWTVGPAQGRILRRRLDLARCRDPQVRVLGRHLRRKARPAQLGGAKADEEPTNAEDSHQEGHIHQVLDEARGAWVRELHKFDGLRGMEGGGNGCHGQRG
mmetsp:Transcript_123116/g.393571  ORF Transcript_123116/g.393571 Transcript_123116/m.393571 type:complete len:485 (+) Transcript_123116:678-2132(+)